MASPSDSTIPAVSLSVPKLRAALVLAGVRANDLAAAARLSRSHLSRILNMRFPLRPRTGAKLLAGIKALGLEGHRGQ